ncbi:hypothetical protein [uncultured Secundilactobacillus sp.]|uniref:hypothetical protein n=1 Tax=uncultured Secundilactobacillus sp. TaxID=2813935 RepID=UPI002588E1C0|nr:hypothetical protein [uncultured Secundilactobacillus sp.]
MRSFSHSALLVFSLIFNRLKLKQIRLVSLFFLKAAIKRPAFWSTILWPLSLVFLVLVLLPFRQIQVLIQVCGSSEIGLYGLVVAVTIITSQAILPILARAVMPDRSTKIHDFLRTFLEPEIEFDGFLLGSIELTVVAGFIYILAFSIILSINSELMSLLSEFFYSDNLVSIFVAIVATFQLLIWGILLTAQISFRVTNKSHINSVFLGVLMFIVFASLISYQLKTLKMGIGFSVFSFVPLISQFLEVSWVDGTLKNLLGFVSGMGIQFVFQMIYIDYLHGKYQLSLTQ